MSILVVDVGTSQVRSAVVRPDGRIDCLHQSAVATHHPSPGIAEFDPAALARAALEVARAALAQAGAVDACGIAAQRASTVLWERASGTPVGPGIGWQDLRTAGQCLALGARGIRLAPNQSATKLAYLLDTFDPRRERDLCFGTVESFVAWTLSRGDLHVTDATNAAVTGLVTGDAQGWDGEVLDALGVPAAMLPRIVDSSGVLGRAGALAGAPPIAGLAGDQQASLLGQGGLHPGEAKATFGTGAMLDCVVGVSRPPFATRGPSGTFPIVARRVAGVTTWGLEAIALAAGSCVAWLRDGLGLIGTLEESDALAGSVPDSGGVSFVPALSGMGTPIWDFGARGTLVGLSGSTTRAEVVHAVLAGIAQRGADLLEAVEADSGETIATLRTDGGMSANHTFAQLLADATSRPVALAAVLEATTLGAAFLAGVASRTWSSLGEAVSVVAPRAVLEPRRRLDRERWLDARERALRTVPGLSALRF